MAQVSLSKVNKIYPTRHGDVHAVKDLDLEINDGDFVALLGPSGCGKTSTLRMIVGLEAISSGTIAFDGKPVNALEPEARNVAMAFETYALYPNFTVAQNLEFPLEVKGVAATERHKQVDRIAQLLRIEPILGMLPGQLSGGQQQRVSLGRALIRDPAVFILDEVMSHIDAHLKFQMLFELKRLHQELGRTMIYVTHDQMEALALAHRVAVMSNALLQQFGTRDELYNRPRNRFIADFIGEPPTNFLTANVETPNRLVVGQGEDRVIFEPDAARADALAKSGNATVLIGIRPQNLSVAPRSPDDGRINVAVAFNEYLGETAILTTRAGGEIARAIAPPDNQSRDGDRIDLYYRRSDVMLFDPKSEDFLG